MIPDVAALPAACQRSDIGSDSNVESDGKLNGQGLGILLSEGMPPTSSIPPFPPSCEPDEAQQSESSESGDRRALTSHTSSGIVDGDNQMIPEPSISRKGKRKMFDQGGDTNARIPAGDGEIQKKYRITTVAEEDSDIEYIGSWRPGKIGQTALKMENLPVKLENPVSDSNVSVKPY